MKNQHNPLHRKHNKNRKWRHRWLHKRLIRFLIILLNRNSPFKQVAPMKAYSWELTIKFLIKLMNNSKLFGRDCIQLLRAAYLLHKSRNYYQMRFQKSTRGSKFMWRGWWKNRRKHFQNWWLIINWGTSLSSIRVHEYFVSIDVLYHLWIIWWLFWAIKSRTGRVCASSVIRPHLLIQFLWMFLYVRLRLSCHKSDRALPLDTCTVP